MTRLVWTSPARRDLSAQVQYLAGRNPAVARRVRDAIREAVARLIDYPYRGRPGKVEGTRELVIAGYPYIVVYRVREARLEVLRVLHTAQDWPH